MGRPFSELEVDEGDCDVGDGEDFEDDEHGGDGCCVVQGWALDEAVFDLKALFEDGYCGG